MGCKDEGTCQVTINGRTGASSLFQNEQETHVVVWCQCNIQYAFGTDSF